MIAALQVTLSVDKKLYTSYNSVFMVFYVIMFNVTDDLDDIFSCDSSSIGHNVGLSVPYEFYGSVMLLLVCKYCYCCFSLEY